MGNYARRNYFMGVAVDASDPGDPSQYRNLLNDTKLFETLGKYPNTEDDELLKHGVWLGVEGVVSPSETHLGFNQVQFDVSNEEGASATFQMFDGLSAGWHTLSARVKMESTGDETICVIFVSNISLESEDDIKILLDGVELTPIGGFGILGFQAQSSPEWRSLVAHIKIPIDMIDDDFFGVALGGINSPGVITDEVVQLEVGETATPWTKSINNLK